MNYKLIAIATLVIAPILATVASHVTEMIPAKQVQKTTAPAATGQQTAGPAPAPTTALTAAPPAGATLEFGAPNPLAGQPMADAGAPYVPTGAAAAGPPPPAAFGAAPSGILPPYPGQNRAPAVGTVYLPDGRKIG